MSLPGTVVRRLASLGRNTRPPSNADGSMSLVDHLYELRARLAKSLAAIVLAAIVAYIYFDPIMDFLQGPYCDLPEDVRGSVEGRCDLYVFDVLGQFKLRLKVAFMTGILFASPIWLYQLWAFITPGLHRNERRYALAFVGSSMVLFAAGGLVAYLTMQKGLELLLSIAGDNVTSLLDVSKYLNYVIAMLLVFGVSFEFPLLVIMLNLVGLVTAAKLRGWRRGIIFGVFVFAAIATPSQDPFTMLALAVPMIVLYEGAMVVATLNDRRRAKIAREEGLDDLSDDEASPLDDGPSPLDDGPSPLDDSPSPLDDAPSPIGSPSAVDDGDPPIR